MLDTMAENSSKLSLPSLYEPSVSMLETGSQRNRYVPVLISLHDRLIDNLLQLRILATHESTSNSKGDHIQGAKGSSNLEVISNHHLEHEKELSVGNISIPVHIIHLERDCPQIRSSVRMGPPIQQSGTG